MKCLPIASGVLALLLNGAVASAQTIVPPPPDPHAVQPERPTVATHAGTVAPGWVELEFGVEFDRYRDRTRGGGAPLVAKIGLASHAQLSIAGTVLQPDGLSNTGVGDLTVGVKWRLLDDAPVLGRLAILPSLKMPTGSVVEATGTGTTDESLLLISSHDLGPVALDLNLGYTHRGGTGEQVPKSQTVWTVSFGGPAAGAFGWTAEVFGYPRTMGPSGSDPIVALLAGPTAQIRSWLAVDAGVIIPFTGPQPHALYFGGVWNIGKL
jgi:hypothetical protein